MTKWFINFNSQIKGPFNADEVKNQIHGLGDDMQTTFIWSRGHSEWTRADKWSPDVPIKTEFTHGGTHSNAGEYTPSPIVEDIKAHAIEKFRVQYDFVDKGEMTKEDFTQFAAKQEDVAKISIFDKKDKLWKEIYSLPDIVQRLGISRREHQRVPILAQFTGVMPSTGVTLSAQVITVSLGGIGITDCFNLKLGETIQGQITSPHFYSPVNITAEVTYAGLDGYVGLKYVNPNDEAMSLIADYIKRFGKDVDEK